MTLNFLSLLFKFHICLLNSVWFLSDSFLKDCLWFSNAAFSNAASSDEMFDRRRLMLSTGLH